MENKKGAVVALATGVGVALAVLLGKRKLTTSTTTTIDPSFGLKGIEVPGDQAEILKVQVLGMDRAKELAMWGTHGVDRNEPTEFVRLIDCTTEHLENILAYGKNVTNDTRRVIESILADRAEDEFYAAQG